MQTVVVKTEKGQFIGVIRESQSISRKLQKAHRTAMRSALQKTGEVWVEEIAPKHFTKKGEDEYKYTRRGRHYQRRKLKHTGQNLPLVKSGESRRRVLASVPKVVGKSVRIPIKAPALNFRNEFSKINMREEITAVSARDVRLMKRTFEQEFGRLFTNPR